MMILLYILFWLVGWIITYMIFARMEEYPRNWDNDKRGVAAFFALFSWVAIVIIILVIIICLVCLGVGWILNKFLVPILKKLEPKIKEE